MNPISRSLFFLAVLIMLIPLYTPIWEVSLEAPQYPDPIGMYIYIDGVKGIGEHDLENINLLNHYIGMKKIVPESIPELKYMKYFVYLFIISGLLIAWFNKKFPVYFWTIVVIAASFVALYDFYLWEKDYGTNLDPLAPIKVENMTYIPPLIGKKQLLNITAYSYPAIGGIFFILSILMALSAAVLNYFGEKKMNNNKVSTISKVNGKANNAAKEFLKEPLLYGLLFFILLFNSCTSGPEPINYNNDECFLCKMLISDERFGGEIITKKGKIYKFDSIECMIEYYTSQDQKEFKELLTVDYSVPKKLIDAKTAFYLHTDEVSSPMGANILSFAVKDSIDTYFTKYNGEKMNFQDVVTKLSSDSE
ncbi:MAG: hypothetical protein KatS3mg027_0417 [Bacteroidia bacterium]|nr:MAG: hypothetical protein KatS3mg027_0417 [Bacteroidia bacterium]